MPTINYETGVRTPPVEETFLPGPPVIEDDEEVEETFFCTSCNSEHSSEEDAYDCCRHYCSDCGESYSDSDEAYECCRYRCESCGESYEYEESAMECCAPYSCEECGARFDDEDEALSCCEPLAPSIDPDVEPYLISVPEMPGRPARYCSLEQELASGGREVAAMLYEHGLSRENRIVGYHSSSGRVGSIHVESDGSLPAAGGEVVYDRFDLNDVSDAAKLSKALTKIRQLRDEHRLVKTSYAAGIHVHIAAKDLDGKCLSTRDMAALHELWTYAEDMLYAISAAGWNRHRQPSDDYSGYCKAVPKVVGTATPTKVWRAMRSDRYYGLNFQRLFSASQRCSCGAAGMGDWNECDCGAMDSATIEWRVFNASTLPRTIHAWIVLAHAITAYASSHEVGTLPVNAYGSQTASEKREVLNHLLDILPLTEGEKEIIEDAANRSPGL